MVLNISDIQLFQILKQKLGEQEAEALVTFVDGKIKDNNEANLNILSTKQDVQALKEDINRLEVKMSENKAETLRWMFGIFLALMLAILGLYIKK